MTTEEVRPLRQPLADGGEIRKFPSEKGLARKVVLETFEIGELRGSWAQAVEVGVEAVLAQERQKPDQVPLRFITNALRRAFTRGTQSQSEGVRMAAQEIADECGVPRDELRRLVVDARIHDLRSEFEDLDFMNRFSEDFDDAS